MDCELSTDRRGGESGGGGGRSGGGDSSGGKKRRTNNNNNDSSSSEMKEVTLLIPNEFMGSVIGAAGKSIKRLMFQAQTTIKCSNSDDLYPGTSSRKVIMTSESAASLDAAQSLLLLGIAQDFPDRFQEVGILIDHNSAGRVIGKGGERIQLLRESCENCQLAEDESNDGERVMIISGDILQLTRTTRMVIDYLTTRSSRE